MVVDERDRLHGFERMERLARDVGDGAGRADLSGDHLRARLHEQRWHTGFGEHDRCAQRAARIGHAQWHDQRADDDAGRQ